MRFVAKRLRPTTRSLVRASPHAAVRWGRPKGCITLSSRFTARRERTVVYTVGQHTTGKTYDQTGLGFMHLVERFNDVQKPTFSCEGPHVPRSHATKLCSVFTQTPESFFQRVFFFFMKEHTPDSSAIKSGQSEDGTAGICPI
jgi:hypothetical protein